ncbi:MAG: bile acid:sodium symporter family protein [Pseudomonadota bacterium]
MEPSVIDQVALNFNAQGLFVINVAIGFMMLGVALDLKVEDFKKILVAPKAPAIGLCAQFILLPAFTYLLTLVLSPLPSIALGMILVAACPGGNLSNIITYLARGNVAVSISMTAVSTAVAIIMTPLNLSLWGSLNPATAAILTRVSLSPLDVFFTIFVILGIPLLVGTQVARHFPGLADKVRKPFKIFSLIFFMVIVAGALATNWANFIKYVGMVMVAVFLHNGMALVIGYWSGRLGGLPEPDCRAVSIEVGIQNSALGLVLVFNFFHGLGGMAIVVAWWGIWHIISGLTAAFIFSRLMRYRETAGVNA